MRLRPLPQQERLKQTAVKRDCSHVTERRACSMSISSLVMERNCHTTPPFGVAATAAAFPSMFRRTRHEGGTVPPYLQEPFRLSSERTTTRVALGYWGPTQRTGLPSEQTTSSPCVALESDRLSRVEQDRKYVSLLPLGTVAAAFDKFSRGLCDHSVHFRVDSVSSLRRGRRVKGLPQTRTLHGPVRASRASCYRVTLD